MKKVLVITYYWPPSGGAGVQRWLKFVKYMGSFGWQPVVYTPSNSEVPVTDDSLLRDVPPGLEVIRRPIWEPYGWYKRFSGKKKTDRINAAFLAEKKSAPGIIEKASIWIRGNLFVPDARVFWVRPSVKFLSEYVRQHNINHIISSGPPHSMHLIALSLKKKFPGISWLADFRDPWTNIDFYDKLMLTPRADRLHRRLEREVLLTADALVSIGATMNREFKTIYADAGGKDTAKFQVITNGFDAADLLQEETGKDEKFTLAHIGTLVKDRNPALLWKVLTQLLRENEQLRATLQVKLVGKVDFYVREQIAAHGLEPYVSYIDYLPHEKVMHEQRRSRVLLLLVNNTPNAKGIVTGKIFEYIATGVPVLAIGPVDGDLADILAETQAGLVCGFNDEEKLRKHILSLFSGQVLAGNPEAIAKYSRHELTKGLCELLDRLTPARAA